MSKRFALLLASLWLTTNASAQAPAQTYRAAVVALTEDAALRRSFESELVALAKSHSYDAVTSYDITSDVNSLDTDAFLKALSDRGVQAVLMVRPAAVGEGSSLEAVRNEVPSRTFADMQKFAKRPSGPANTIIIPTDRTTAVTMIGISLTMPTAVMIESSENTRSMTMICASTAVNVPLTEDDAWPSSPSTS